ncbi:hypothetical protein B0H14DRAFT_3605388 [Mycena olivaceomarginata]|nr:hypothetical protein B0H14DRAFT_3605388 [Mycena olivaceomarginata]
MWVRSTSFARGLKAARFHVSDTLTQRASSLNTDSLRLTQPDLSPRAPGPDATLRYSDSIWEVQSAPHSKLVQSSRSSSTGTPSFLLHPAAQAIDVKLLATASLALGVFIDVPPPSCCVFHFVEDEEHARVCSDESLESAAEQLSNERSLLTIGLLKSETSGASARRRRRGCLGKLSFSSSGLPKRAPVLVVEAAEASSRSRQGCRSEHLFWATESLRRAPVSRRTEQPKPGARLQVRYWPSERKRARKAVVATCHRRAWESAKRKGRGDVVLVPISASRKPRKGAALSAGSPTERRRGDGKEKKGKRGTDGWKAGSRKMDEVGTNCQIAAPH